MGEYNEQTNHPNLYERFAPEYRFVRISNAVLEQIGESPPDGTKTRFANWQGKEKDDRFKLQAREERTAWGHKSTIYYLEHYTDDMPSSRPIERYTASTNGGAISRIGVFDVDSSPIHTEPTDRANAIRQLLSILHDVAPHDSDKLLDELFAARYESLIGAFVLSDLALEGTEEEITELVAWEAIEDHVERVDAIKELVLDRSKRRDSPAKQETIEEAVMNSRTRTNKNAYEPVNIQTVTERVAKEIGKRWKYTVSPEQ